MLTSKQRAQLKGLASKEPSILQIGKGDIGENVIRQADEALLARELVKGTVLPNCEKDARQIGQSLADATESELVIAIGRKFVLYRKNPEKRKIALS